jgi:glycosyltransferase involved in cell wall biosynthesis
MSGAGLKILVYPHAMEVGGSQLNAIELAGAVRDLGHDVTILSDEGPLLQRVHDLRLPHLPLPDPRRRPSPVVVRQLRRLVRERGVQIVHGYEWPPALEAAAAAYRNGKTAAVCTVMSMAVAPFLPRSMPLVVGTRALRERTATLRPGPVYLIEPPVDVVGNAPGHPVDEFRAAHRLTAEPDGVVDIAIVCRLVPELKLEGILTAVDVVGELGQELPVRLVIAGDGKARDTVEEHAAKANARAGRRAVVLVGEVLDPRPVYASADIVLGMGGSALRALAFGVPLVVQGERGFWELLTPDSCDLFLQQGWYGVGTGGDSSGHEKLSAILRQLVPDRDRRAALGAYGRELAVERFSLERAARMQEEIYRAALADGPAKLTETVDGVRSAAGVFSHKLRQKYRGLRGTRAADDFNTVTLANAAMKRR